MARRKLQFVAGTYYHIYNRGAHRMSIFRDDLDYLYVLRAMEQYCAALDLTMIAYCLMPNHFHWLVRQNGVAPASLLPQRVFNGYVKAYNSRHAHQGTLFEERYKGKVVDHDAYLRHLCCYIHANPVKDGFATSPELWPYSNYQEWLGLRQGTLVDHNLVRQYYPEPGKYRDFVFDYLHGRGAIPESLRAYLATL